MTSTDIAELMLSIIDRHSFERWYTTEFESFIAGDEDAPSREEIVAFLGRAVEQRLK